ncbi:MAG: NAD(P)/FAD-dependent oxidoreductase [Gammaproteobacteria bacterium]|nr:NAD(P)/FAD-dependent oxidoreductase [Gammaproteobacteria bacterium]MDH4253619.1 NAD(P)/FAD-dependent oxidoreductase [Gammaproteobacteria bacterium]MDH5310382.1 NAD(P)/FAD-dependent oxidoreductase [Gammaproteobacteria bacterium]
MKKDITRRDFLNGTQVAIGASLLSPWTEVFGALPSKFELGPDYYPPAITGLRGSHDGSWETMHARVSGATWSAGAPEEAYDLVVVGAGISGLSAAHFFGKANPGARILVLDNHDDFGGHAKRNEFGINNETRIGYGGTESIDTPSGYTEIARELLVEIGIDVERFYDYYDQDLYSSMGLSHSVLYDEATFGKRKLVTGYGKRSWEDFAADTPMSDRAKADLVRLFNEDRDYLPGKTYDEKVAYLATISYRDFLEKHADADEQIIRMYERWGMSYWCVGIDEIPAIQVQGYDDGGGMPGLKYTVPRVGNRGDEPYIFHFPDGNASVARLLVRKLLPEAVPGKTMEDVVTARVNYSMLDREGAPVRIRLNSTVVNAVHNGDASAVDITYVHQGDAHKVRAGKCIMACYNSAIPYLCPELPEEQVEGLRYNVKVPLTYTKVLVKNWRAFADLGTRFVFYTNDFYKQVELDYPVSLGDYRFGSSPDDPMVLHMCYVPYFADIQGPEQWREGRRKLLTTPFAEFEHHVRDQLDQALSGAGFDAERDIQAITVNRWAHGYAYNPHLLWEKHWPDENATPWVIGRQRYGRIAIANSDSGAAANTNSAITNGYRAVQDLLKV